MGILYITVETIKNVFHRKEPTFIETPFSRKFGYPANSVSIDAQDLCAFVTDGPEFIDMVAETLTETQALDCARWICAKAQHDFDLTYAPSAYNVIEAVKEYMSARTAWKISLPAFRAETNRIAYRSNAAIRAEIAQMDSIRAQLVLDWAAQTSTLPLTLPPQTPDQLRVDACVRYYRATRIVDNIRKVRTSSPEVQATADLWWGAQLCPEHWVDGDPVRTWHNLTAALEVAEQAQEAARRAVWPRYE